MAAITFNVQESADASYFTIVNEGVDVATQLILTVIDPNSVTYNYTITVDITILGQIWKLSG